MDRQTATEGLVLQLPAQEEWFLRSTAAAGLRAVS